LLLSGPPSLAALILIQPGIQVNLVIDAAAAKFHMRHVEFCEQGNPDPQVASRLFLGEATHNRQGQAVILHD
jgi:hypothetical protein